jgi:hypothetical protein
LRRIDPCEFERSVYDFDLWAKVQRPFLALAPDDIAVMYDECIASEKERFDDFRLTLSLLDELGSIHGTTSLP